MNAPFLPVDPISPAAPWLGGKRNLAKRICVLIDAASCTTYYEPFVGMGGIFLRRSRRPKAEVINDRGRDVAKLFRILQRHYPQFLEVLRFQLTTRAEFNRLVDTNCPISDVCIDECRLPLFIARATLRELIAELEARTTGGVAR